MGHERGVRATADAVHVAIAITLPCRKPRPQDERRAERSLRSPDRREQRYDEQSSAAAALLGLVLTLGSAAAEEAPSGVPAPAEEELAPAEEAMDAVALPSATIGPLTLQPTLGAGLAYFTPEQFLVRPLDRQSRPQLRPLGRGLRHAGS